MLGDAIRNSAAFCRDTPGLTGTFTVDGGTSALYLYVVPEPDTATMVGSLGVLALLRRRRK